MRTSGAALRGAVVVCALALVASGCSSGGGDTDRAGTAGSTTTGPGTSSGPTHAVKIPGSGSPMPGGSRREQVSSLVQSAYYWSGDDDGQKPGDKAEMILVFEPTGDADLIVQDPEDQLTLNGDWSYDGAKLSLTFATDELTIDESFPLDLTAPTTTMPFRLLSGGAAGKSTWVRGNADPLAHLDVVFRVATLGQDQADGDAGVQRAADYANEVIRLDNGGKPANLVHGLRAAPAAAPSITSVTPARGEVTITWSDGTTAIQRLYGFAAAPTSTLSLSQGPLAGDPRTHLPTKPSGQTSGDPPKKTALFVGTLESRVVYSWYDGIVNGGVNSGALAPAKDAFDWDGMATDLKARGYSVSRLFDDDASVEGLIGALAKSPGLVVLNTHGSASGSLMTRDLLMEPADTKVAYADGTLKAKLDVQLDLVRKRLKKAGYGDLATYKKGAALGIFGVPAALMTGGQAWYVGLTPVFWDYLRDMRKVDLSKSLVYLGACDVDQSNLRDHVRAGSFLAYRLEVHPKLAAAVGSYLVKSLAKPSWSAEEAFYNMVRVVNTKQATYQHDTIFDGLIPADSSGKSPLFDPTGKPLDQSFMLNGYGLQGNTVVPYAGHGWLNPATHDVAQVWWMMWAARWGQDSVAGSKMLADCWSLFWSTGDKGGLKSPFCNAANVGSVPTQAEVEYARFLLTGAAPPADALSRWTLNESP